MGTKVVYLLHVVALHGPNVIINLHVHGAVL